MSTAHQVQPWQRFTRQRPCPICEGYDGARRGSDHRCWGNLSADETLAFCTQREAAGQLTPNANGSYTHRLNGPCRCGQQHGTHYTSTPQPPKEKPAPTPRPAQRGPFPQVLDGAKLTKVYTYQREDGTRAYSVLRYEYPKKPEHEKPEKTFRQITHLDTDRWTWGLGDTERVLYQLPRLLAAPPVRPVFITEGEKAAEALIAFGLIATTCSEGAEKWHQAPGRHDALRNRHVVILADNDEKGAKHAQQVAADVQGVAASVRIITLPGLPEKGDVVEWIATGGTKDTLYELVIATQVEGAQQGTSSTADAAMRAREEAIRKEVARRKELEAQNVWRRQLAANKHLGATTKLVAWAVQEERTSKNLSPSDDMCVYLPNIAERAGVSPQTAGDALKKLSEAEALNRRVESHIGAGGHKVTRVTISPTPLFATPHKVVPQRRAIMAVSGAHIAAARASKSSRSSPAPIVARS